MFQMGLYYPCHFFSDDAWLKAAALYWPQMARIVADGHQVEDSDTTRALMEELEFVVDVDPAQAAHVVAPMIGDVLREYGDDLARRYHVDLRQASQGFIWSELKTFDEISAGMFEPPGKTISYKEIFDEADYYGYHLVALHPADIHPDLRADLIAAGLAFVYGPWLAMRCEVAWVYKCVLAEEVARQNLLSPTTDHTMAYCAGQGWTVERVREALMPDSATPPPPSVALGDKLGMLAVQLILPADIAHLSVKKIAQIRQRHGSDFDAFCAALDGATKELGSDLGDVRDPTVLDAYLRQEVERRFKKPLQDLESALKASRIETVFGAVNTKFELPAALATMGGATLAGHPVIGGIGGAAFGVLALRQAARREFEERWKPSPATYLLHAQRTLSPDSWLRKLSRARPD
jgi:hypothetical protein